MSVKIKRNSALTALNITPLIDIVFLLLIFILVTSNFEKEEQSLAIEPPQASEAVPLTAQPQQLTISIGVDRKYYIGGEVLDAAGLDKALLRDKIAHPEGRRVIVRADKKVDWQTVATALNLCTKHGYREILPAMSNE